MSAIFHYPEGVQVNFSCTFSNEQPGLREQFFGKDGTIDIVHERQLFLYSEPTSGKRIEEYSISNAALAGKTSPELHVQNFFDCVRSRRPTNCPAEIGEASALCAHLSTIALREQRTVHWDAMARRSS
jgi:hypothetical protein